MYRNFVDLIHSRTGTNTRVCRESRWPWLIGQTARGRNTIGDLKTQCTLIRTRLTASYT